MKDLLTYYSDNPTIIELLDKGVYFSELLLKEFNVEKNQRFPAITQSDSRTVHMAKWGIENPIMPTGPELSYLFAPTLLRQESLKTLLQSNRIILPVKQYVQQLPDGRSVILKSPTDQILYLAGVWYSGKERDPSFALITQNSNNPSSLRRVPLLIGSDDMNKWLDKETPILSMYSRFLDQAPSYAIEYQEHVAMQA